MTVNKISFPRSAILMMLIFVVLVPLLPLIISRRWSWWEAWVYALVSIAGFVVSRALAARRNPDLISERARYLNHEDAKPWDKLLSPLVGLGGGLIPLVAGIEALFNPLAVFNLATKVAALILIIAGYALGSYALIENRYFSGIVRIQSERNHKVVSSGPYRWMRHPGYSGAILTYLATPIFLDSPWAFLPAIFLTAVLVIRTSLEDHTLRQELAGYQEYAEQTRYRLLPGIW